MRIKIKRVDSSLPLPQYETAGSVAFDFVVREDTVIPAKGFGRAPSNVIIEIPKGYMVWVTDRSSTLKKTGLLITEGVIDGDYCGDDDEILLQFYNPTDADVAIKRGDRVAQGVFLPVGRGEWEEVTFMGNKNRGGFGSTDQEAKKHTQQPAVPSPTHSFGKMIVLYGINNLGKSTQARLLVERLKEEGCKAEYLKYPIYNLAPTGPMINEYLRMDNPDGLTFRELQELYALNRYTYEPTLVGMLKRGVIVVAEDYWGTGVAWGTAQGLDKQFLLQINGAVLKEDLAFYFHGNRFRDAAEIGHTNEGNDGLMERARAVHEELAREFGWVPIDANLPIEEIHALIWEQIIKII